MFKTKNDLSETVRAKAIEMLNARLADAIDLQTQTKQAHWNVKGPNFIALHELFDEINEDVEDYVDDIAERWRRSAVRHARQSTRPTTSTPPTCSRKSRAASTSGCGLWRLTCRRNDNPLL